VVGDGQGGHPQFLSMPDQFLDLAQAIQQAELSVDMEVDEVFFVRHVSLSPFPARHANPMAISCGHYNTVHWR